jgi:hypothetical protein
MVKLLTMLKDGVDGRDLGVIGASQYAITDAGDIMRRRAADLGTYGGWRWECSATHARFYPVLYEGVIRAIDGMEAWLPCR